MSSALRWRSLRQTSTTRARRSVGHAGNWAQVTRARQERYVSPAAVGAHGGRRSRRRVFRDRIFAGDVAARGIFGTFLGPWSAGTLWCFSLRPPDTHIQRVRPALRGRDGSLHAAMASAANQAGAAIRRKRKSSKSAPRMMQPPAWSYPPGKKFLPKASSQTPIPSARF